MSWVIVAGAMTIGQMVTLSPKGQEKHGALPEGTTSQVRLLHQPPIDGYDCVVRWRFADKTIRDIDHAFDELETTQ